MAASSSDRFTSKPWVFPAVIALIVLCAAWIGYSIWPESALKVVIQEGPDITKAREVTSKLREDERFRTIEVSAVGPTGGKFMIGGMLRSEGERAPLMQLVKAELGEVELTDQVESPN